MNKKDNSQIHPRLVNYWDEEIMLQKKSNGLCGLKKNSKPHRFNGHMSHSYVKELLNF